MQTSTSVCTQTEYGEKCRREPSRRLTPADYAKAGILMQYDWSVKDREAHDEEMEKYRQYLMELCSLSHEIEETKSQKEP
ncbi:MAG: hypothetical protein NWF00_11615 [Candidatus Bathyarchaeota archaeon]|nr:hypothetical protein [Candidatus Bathyarchaeota archaeon]